MSLAVVLTEPSPTMTQEVIDAAAARGYLSLAARNRPVRPGVVSQYARDMNKGRWFASVIRFATDGLLHDGQHRLLAVIESNTEQPFWVERNAPVEAMTIVDTGLRRTVGDVLTMRGEQHANVLAAAARLARFLTLFPAMTPSGQSKSPASTEEILEYLQTNPEIRHSVNYGNQIARAIGFPPSPAAALHYLTMGRSRELANPFWEQLLTGVDMDAETGPYALREKFLGDRLKPYLVRMDTNYLVAVTIKAWCYWEQGKAIKQLRWLRGGQSPEPYPFLGKKYD